MVIDQLATGADARIGPITSRSAASNGVPLNVPTDILPGFATVAAEHDLQINGIVLHCIFPSIPDDMLFQTDGGGHAIHPPVARTFRARGIRYSRKRRDIGGRT
jgi:hypothetical protein